MTAADCFPRFRSSSPRRRHGLWLALAALVLLGGGATGRAQMSTYAAPTPRPRGFFLFRPFQQPVAQQVAPLQDPARTSPRLDEPAPDNAHVLVSLSKQRAYLLYGNDVVLDSPISSGKLGHTTPKGTFHIQEKDPAHHSNIYGNFMDRTGRIVRSGVSERIDTAPSGTHFEGAPMRWFMRLTGEGVGMHIGILPGYAASHGCIRLPADIAPLIYQRVKVGTTVVVQE